MKNVEPITDKEIEDFKLKEMKIYKRNADTMGKTIIISVIVLGVVFFGCTIYVLKWHTITLFASLVVINFIISIILKRKINAD